MGSVAVCARWHLIFSSFLREDFPCTNVGSSCFSSTVRENSSALLFGTTSAAPLWAVDATKGCAQACTTCSNMQPMESDVQSNVFFRSAISNILVLIIERPLTADTLCSTFYCTKRGWLTVENSLKVPSEYRPGGRPLGR